MQPKLNDQRNMSETEQLVSMLGGGALLLLSITRLSKNSLLYAIGGGYLIYRGLSGWSYLNAMLGIDRSPGVVEPRVSVQPEEKERKPAEGEDIVQEASEESFPASDAPAWTSGPAI